MYKMYKYDVCPGVREKHADWEAVLEEALAQGGSAPAHLLQGVSLGEGGVGTPGP